MLKEFRDFINRGNVMDLAVAVIIGAAFTAIVNSLVNDLIMPLIGIIVGGLDFSSLSFSVGDAVFTYGNFIQAVINFLLVAFVLFLIVRSINNLHQDLEKEEEEIPEEEPQPSAEEILLTEIRDLLKKKKSKK